MNNLKNTSKMLPVLLLFVLVSCKKKNPQPDAATNEIVTNELLNYYLVAEHKTGPNKLMVAYFNQDGSTVDAQAHLQEHQVRTRAVTIKDRQFNIDFNKDGKSMYNFTLEKDASGNLILKTYDFVYNGEGNQLAHATLIKKVDAPPFDGSNFKMIRSNVPFEMIKDGIPFSFLSGAKSMIWTNRIKEYHNLINIGFKTTDDEYMAVMVPGWKDIKTPIMLLETRDVLFIAAKQ